MVGVRGVHGSVGDVTSGGGWTAGVWVEWGVREALHGRLVLHRRSAPATTRMGRPGSDDVIRTECAGKTRRVWMHVDRNST
jgi:hypothetical protein